MAKIPYSPAGTVEPSGQAVNAPQVRAVPDAFGAGVAEATSKLGRQLESSSDEIFKVALHMQNQYNDAAAKEADAQYIIQSSNLHAEYNSLQGKEAIDARPKYLEDLTSLRENIRNTLSNPTAQKIYDSTTRQNFARTVFASASHAAQQGRKYAEQGNEAIFTAAKEQAAAFPDDPELFNDNARKAVTAARNVAISKGMPPEAVSNVEKDAYSAVVAQRLQSLARNDPIKASEMMAELPPGVLRGKDRESTEKLLIDGKRATYAKLYSDETVFGVDLESGKVSTEELIAQATKKAEKQIAKDPLLEVSLRNQVIGDVQRLKGLGREKRIDAQMNIERIVGGLDDPNAPKPTSLAQVLATKDGQQAWSQLDEKKQRMYLRQLELNQQNNLRQTTQSEFFRLQGMAEEDPQGFMNESIATNDKLSAADQRKLYALQQKKRKEPEKDPQVQAAMRGLRPMLQAAGITPDRKDDYYQFQGAMQDAMADYRMERKKPMPYDEIQLTGARLLQDQSFGTGDRWLGTGNQSFFPGKSPIYRTSVPDAERTKIIDAYQRKKGIIPEDSIIQREFVRMQYQKLYGGAASKPKDESRPSTNTLGPQVPQ